MSSAIQVMEGQRFERILTEAAILQRVRGLAKALVEDYAHPPQLLAVLRGAFVFAADLMRALPASYALDFVQVKSYEGMQSGGHPVIQWLGDGDYQGKDLVLIEDLVDSGHTLRNLLDALKEKQPASVRVMSLFYKPDSAPSSLIVDYIGFHLDPAYVIGYGMDYLGSARGLRDLYAHRGSADEISSEEEGRSGRGDETGRFRRLP